MYIYVFISVFVYAVASAFLSVGKRQSEYLGLPRLVSVRSDVHDRLYIETGMSPSKSVNKMFWSMNVSKSVNKNVLEHECE